MYQDDDEVEPAKVLYFAVLCLMLLVIVAQACSEG